MIHLALTDFAAVTPGVVSPDGWKSWAATGVKPAEEVVPVFRAVAQMLLPIIESLPDSQKAESISLTADSEEAFREFEDYEPSEASDS